jgi:hypothetical protein
LVFRQTAVGSHYKNKTMNRILTFIFISTTIFSGTKIVAQSDHLEPANSIFTILDYQFEYYSQVRNILFKDLDDNPVFRFFVMPSFSPENVLNIGMNHDTKKHFISYHVGNENIWYSENKEKIKVIKRKKEISQESVELIKELYKIAISKAKYIEKEHIGADGKTYYTIKKDGETYYFSINDQGQKTGITWSPTEGTLMAELVLIGNELIKMTEEKESLVSINQELKIRIENLIKKIK